MFIGLPLLAVGGLAAGYLGIIRGLEQPVTAADRGVLITGDDLARTNGGKLAGEGTIRHARYVIGGRELSYEYESPSGGAEQLYVNCRVSIERSERDARNSYTAQRLGADVGLKLFGEGLRLKDQPKPFSWGDESSSSLMVSGEAKVGNVFMARKGKRVFVLMVVGLLFESGEDLGELLAPVLARLEAYRPE